MSSIPTTIPEDSSAPISKPNGSAPPASGRKRGAVTPTETKAMDRASSRKSVSRTGRRSVIGVPDLNELSKPFGEAKDSRFSLSKKG